MSLIARWLRERHGVCMARVDRTRRDLAFLCVGIVGVLIGIFGLAKWFLSYDGRSAIDLSSFVQDPGPSMPGAAMATADLCTTTLACIQGVDSTTLTLRRFDSAQQASAAAATLGGDVRFAGWIVVEFKPGALAEDNRSNFMSALYCLHVGPDPC
ncbi:hypothetical protein ACWKWC_03215 [Geodermatophilus nigrescens]